MQSLTGIWHNELKSRMIITSATDGQLLGTYETAVGNADGPYQLDGRFESEGKTLGWVVSWKNEKKISKSSTSWSGKYEADCDGNIFMIRTTWLITRAEKPDWDSTNVSFDVFTRGEPPKE